MMILRNTHRRRARDRRSTRQWRPSSPRAGLPACARPPQRARYDSASAAALEDGGDVSRSRGETATRLASRPWGRGHPRYAKDDGFFRTGSLCAACWGGFIAGDGHMSDDATTVTIEINVRDRPHLEDFVR